MNLLGKIFVFVVFVFSLIFATFSIMVYSTHKNWRDEIERPTAKNGMPPGWKARLDEERNENNRLRDERKKYELQANAEKAAKLAALARSEAVIQNLAAQKDKAEKDLRAKDTELAANTEALRITQDNLTKLTAEVKRLRDEIVVAHRDTDAQVKQATALSDQLAIASGELALIKERNEQLMLDVDRAKQLLQSVGKSVADPVDASTINVNGVVTSVSRSKVELSIGKDDGVRVGQELDIYRGDKYVGRVRVLEARADNAVGSILSEYQQYPIQRGDHVASRL